MAQHGFNRRRALVFILLLAKQRTKSFNQGGFLGVVFNNYQNACARFFYVHNIVQPAIIPKFLAIVIKKKFGKHFFVKTEGFTMFCRKRMAYFFRHLFFYISLL